MRMKMFCIVYSNHLYIMRFLLRTENLQKIYLTNLQDLMDLQYTLDTFTRKNYIYIYTNIVT